MHTQAHMHACPHACMPTRMHAHTHACTHACMPTRMHAHTHACPHAYMPTRMHAHTHACTHACIHTRMHAHAGESQDNPGNRPAGRVHRDHGWVDPGQLGYCPDIGMLCLHLPPSVSFSLSQGFLARLCHFKGRWRPKPRKVVIQGWVLT